MTFSLSSDEHGKARIAIAGELDGSSTRMLQPVLDDLADHQPTLVEIDLHELRMIDSVGIGALVVLYKRLQACGNRLVISGVHEQPRAIFRLLGLDRVMMAEGRDPR